MDHILTQFRPSNQSSDFMANDGNQSVSQPSLRDWFYQDIEKPAAEMAGGLRRLKVLVLLASVLGLDAADKATVGAVAAQLERSFHIGNIEVGLLVTVSTAIGAIATLPMGILVDRMHRGRLLIIGIVVWSGAMIACGASESYLMLLLSRLGLGAVIAVVSPAVASLTGDFFRPYERGRVYGYILTGELFGAGLGFLVSGDIASVFSWRFSFWLLAAIGMLMALALWKLLPEPQRGATTNSLRDFSEKEGTRRSAKEAYQSVVSKEVEAENVSPHRELVLHEDPVDLSWWRVLRYVLKIRTNVILMLAMALGYFYFTGIRTFGIVFMRGWFHLSQSAGTEILVGIGIGAIVGVVAAGRTADWLIKRNHPRGRIWVGAGAFLVATVFFLAGLLTHSLAAAAPIFFIAGAGLGAVNSPINAARLDIMHHHLWGRAESIRASARYVFEAAAPLVFGYVAAAFGGSKVLGYTGTAATNEMGLHLALLVMLLALVVGAGAVFTALMTYERDVETAIVTERSVRENSRSRDSRD